MDFMNKLPSINTLHSSSKIVLPSINNLNLPSLNLLSELLPNQYRTYDNYNTSVQQTPSPTINILTPDSDRDIKDEVDTKLELESDDAIIEKPDGEDKKKWKPRKKRQCPECKLFFSNLATHKSTHLNPDSRPHICNYCSRGFARPNDLFRHVKCHWKEIGVDKGQFKCPFKNHSFGDHCGHNSGVFSRCDTFKNHLKAIHFQYPNGTRKDQRLKTPGNCRLCQLPFSSVDVWLTEHVEKNQCKFANEYKKC